MGIKRVVGLTVGCVGIGFLKKAANNSVAPAPGEASTSLESSRSSPAASSKIKLRDGRCLAYKERGVPIGKSNYRVIVVHGFASSKDMNFMAAQKLMEELGIYLVLYDRAGYGESDPNQKRSLKSEASDIQELADQLKLGSKLYVVGVSVGAYPTWSCLKLMPERLAGVALVVPFINYRWPSLPRDLTKDDYRRYLSRLTMWVASHAPGVLQWWLTQEVLPSSSVFDRNAKFFSSRDLEFLKNGPGFQLFSKVKLRQEAAFDSLRLDFMVAFGKWEFDPLDLKNPFAQSKSALHIWQGYEDKVVPFRLQRYVWERLPWIRYHEVRDGGHLLIYDSDICEAILRSLLLGDDPQLYRTR